MNNFLKQNWFKVSTILLILILGLIYFSREKVDRLDPPIIKNLDDKSGSSIKFSGIGYPRSRVLLYIDDQYHDEVLADNQGNFEKNVVFNSEGEIKLKAKQVYKNISSDFSEEHLILVDLTAPNPNTLRIEPISEFYNKKEVTIHGSANPSDSVLLNGNYYKISTDGDFSISYSLNEGENNLRFQLVDGFQNKTDVIYSKTVKVDSLAPKIDTDFCSRLNEGAEATEEYVCLDIGHWEGYLDSYNSVAITGSVKGNVKSITIDGKGIFWDENNEIYQRLSIFINGGLNKYKVVVTDKAGNISTDYLETTAERTKKELDLNINE